MSDNDTTSTARRPNDTGTKPPRPGQMDRNGAARVSTVDDNGASYPAGARPASSGDAVADDETAVAGGTSTPAEQADPDAPGAATDPQGRPGALAPDTAPPPADETRDGDGADELARDDKRPDGMAREDMAREDMAREDMARDDDRPDGMARDDKRPDGMARAGQPLPDAAHASDQATGQMAPGDVPDPGPVSLWPSGSVEALRERWREVQLAFVDDPGAAAAEADGLVNEAVQTLTTAMARQRTELAGWRNDESDDTERLRLAVQRYRQFFDRVLML
jgi:hypothetical protein